jgi:2-polyprenyl-6-methoxyphenol hydroxylase-like FAD-dependent oxidoreductase
MNKTHSHAIVLGGSIAGLCAARALAEHFSRVTLIERDVLDDSIAARKGVPQGNHLHTLLASGGRVLERMFPGFREALIARGATPDDIAGARYCIAGVRLAAAQSELELLRMSRPLLEGYIRERVLALPNLTLLDACDIIGLTVADDVVRGVRIVRRQLQLEQWLPSDLVVDATGRGSKLPSWLRDFGFEMPHEDRVRVDIGYTSCTYRRRPGQAGGRTGILIGPAAPNTRCGVGAVMEGDRWIVSLVGYLGDHAPNDIDGLTVFARGLPKPDLYQLLCEAEPLSRPIPARFPHSQRRYYERLRRFPQGLLAIGDALCSFNPMYAQGMSVAALEAELLGRCLHQSYRGDQLRRAFFRGCSAIIETPWRLAVGGDLRFPAVEGPRPLAARVRNAYLKRLARAAGADPEVALAFLRVTNLVRPPASLFAPGVMRRVAAHAFARRPQLRQLSALADAPDPARVPVVERVP